MADYTHLLTPRATRVLQEASPLRRAGAFLLDILCIDLIVTAPFTPLFTSMVGRIGKTGITGFTYTARELALVVVIFLIAYAYFVLFEYVLGQTPGMMLLGTVAEPALWQALVRNSFLLPFFPFVMFWFIEPFAILFSRRGVLERISGTRTFHQREVLF